MINFEKAETPAEILKQIKDKADEVYRLKLACSVAEEKFKAAKADLLDIMVNAEVDKFTADDCIVTAELKTSCTVPKEIPNKLKLFDYILANCGQDVLNSYLTINQRSFSSWHDEEVRKHISAGNLDFKLDMIEPYTYNSLGIRKRKAKE